MNLRGRLWTHPLLLSWNQWVNNDTVKKVITPHCPLSHKEPFLFFKGSPEYNHFLIDTQLGRIAARIQKKYFSSANITKVEINRDPNVSLYFGLITIHFDYDN